MERLFVIVTPDCPHYKGRKIGSKECTQCEHFRGGIVQNFVDCARNRAEIAQKSQKIEHGAKSGSKSGSKSGRKSSGRKTATANKVKNKPIRAKRKLKG